MCLVFIVLGYDKDTPLVVLTNRDEFYNRETTKLKWHELSNKQILTPMDISSNGAQFCVGKNGNFAVLTNFREYNKKYIDAHKSRGELTMNFIKNNYTPENYIKHLINTHANYSGFNIIFGDVTGKNIWFFSNKNIQSNNAYTIQKLDFNNIYGIGNGYFNPNWWKVSRGIEMIKNINRLDYKNLFSILTDSKLAPHEYVQTTGYPHEFEYNLSGIYCNKYMNQDKEFGTIGSYTYIVKHTKDNNYLVEVSEHCKYITPNLYRVFKWNIFV